MKRIIAFCAAALLALSLAGCAGGAGDAAYQDGRLDGSLEELIDRLYEGIPEDERPMAFTSEVTEENSVYELGVERGEYVQAYTSGGMRGMAHQVSLVRAESPEQARQLAETIEENAKPDKWICVGAEKTVVDRIGDVVLLVMSSADLADAVHENFKALAG
mgnify:CR=1 FL=1